MERYYLMSSKDFGKTLNNKNDRDYRFFRDNYDNFLEQPLTLGMFVPCDKSGDVIDNLSRYPSDQEYLNVELDEQYQQAKERVLFEGFEVTYKSNISIFINDVNIRFNLDGSIKSNSVFLVVEDLLRRDVTLTESAIKQLGI